MKYTSKSKAVFIAILAVVVTIVVVIVCVADVARSKQTSVTSGETFEVAVLMPFTTDFAWWGEAIKNSINVAVSDGHAKNLSFFYEDTKCDTKDAVSATQSLKATHPNLHIFVVGCDSDLKAMIPLLDTKKDLAFMAGLSGADLYESHFPVINLAYRLETEGSLAANFASQQLGAKKAGIMVDNQSVGGAIGTSFADQFSKNGGTSITEKLSHTDSDIGTAVLKILQSKPDIVYVQNDVPAMVSILKKLDQFGYTGKRMLYYGGKNQLVIDGAGKAAEGVYVPAAISEMSSDSLNATNGTSTAKTLDTTNSAQKKFEQEFRISYGTSNPFITAYFVYDGISLLSEAHASCHQNIRCIETYFYSKRDFAGVLGKVQYQPAGQIERNFYFEQIRRGSFVAFNPKKK